MSRFRMKTSPFSLRLDPKMKLRLEKEAKRRNRTASFIANHALKSYFEGLDRFSKDLDDAFKEADKGVFISEEAMDAWIASWGTDHELPPPEPDIFLEPKVKKKVA
jgi:predicted transcriptional regulator